MTLRAVTTVAATIITACGSQPGWLSLGDAHRCRRPRRQRLTNASPPRRPGQIRTQVEEAEPMSSQVHFGHLQFRPLDCRDSFSCGDLVYRVGGSAYRTTGMHRASLPCECTRAHRDTGAGKSSCCRSDTSYLSSSSASCSGAGGNTSSGRPPCIHEYRTRRPVASWLLIGHFSSQY